MTNRHIFDIQTHRYKHRNKQKVTKAGQTDEQSNSDKYQVDKKQQTFRDREYIERNIIQVQQGDVQHFVGETTYNSNAFSLSCRRRMWTETSRGRY